MESFVLPRMSLFGWLLVSEANSLGRCMESFVLPRMPVFGWLLVSEANSHWGGVWKALYCHACPYLVGCW